MSGRGHEGSGAVGTLEAEDDASAGAADAGEPDLLPRDVLQVGGLPARRRPTGRGRVRDGPLQELCRSQLQWKSRMIHPHVEGGQKDGP